MVVIDSLDMDEAVDVGVDVNVDVDVDALLVTAAGMRMNE